MQKKGTVLTSFTKDGAEHKLKVTQVIEDFSLSPSSELVKLITLLHEEDRIEYMFGLRPEEVTLEFLQMVKNMLVPCNVFYFEVDDKLAGSSWLEHSENSDTVKKIHFISLPWADKFFTGIANAFFDVLKKDCGVKYLRGNTCAKFFHVVRLLQELGFVEVYRTKKTFKFRNAVYDTIVSYREM